MTTLATARSPRCSICDQLTHLACADCWIDRRRTVYVCPTPACRDAHEDRADCTAPAHRP